MITGYVNANREAILTISICDENGLEHEWETVVDTGFDGWLSLPPELIDTLGLSWQRFGRAILADGSESAFNIFGGDVLWDGQLRTINIYEMDAEPLLGMSLMYGYELFLPVLDGAVFTLSRIGES